MSSLESGANNGRLGYFATLSYFDEEGWRDASPSRSFNFFGTVGWHTETGTLDLNVSYGDSKLIGNGPAPVQLLALDRAPLYPPRHHLEGAHWFNDRIQLSGAVSVAN